MFYSLKIEQSLNVVFIPVYLVRKSDVETKHNTHTHTQSQTNTHAHVRFHTYHTDMSCKH